MDTPKKMNNPLKEALGRNVGAGLPSNFNYRMLAQIRMEAEKRRKRRAFVVLLSLIAACAALVSMAVYTISTYLDFNLKEYLPSLDLGKANLELAGFYGYIGMLVLLLLGIDYWVRKRHVTKGK
ncbi:hypothetical protein [Bacteroides sp. 224]|uniref:hypothetical protein n=1 Tax=Bacteroides sp. 224 TaxID=2302936 RepID=UPI0013D04D6C|nr:hypothetical protein [Bacteroides sp. 224]NDV65358.1 hypothetical protein [Bacteroides sp. 224]